MVNCFEMNIKNMDLPLDIPERTEFTDDAYGVLGRALAFATEYERNCRSLAGLLGLKIETYSKLLDDDEILGEFCFSIWEKSKLYKNIEAVKDILNIGEEVISKLHIGRDARNYVAHEAAIGARRILEIDSEQKLLIDDLSKKVRELAEANLIIHVISKLVTKEPHRIPTENYLRTYPDKVVEWACEV